MNDPLRTPSSEERSYLEDLGCECDGVAVEDDPQLVFVHDDDDCPVLVAFLVSKAEFN